VKSRKKIMSKSRENENKPVWSVKKRMVVSIVGTLVILVAALIIGVSMYAVGLKGGLFTSQSLKRLTLASLAKDKAFVEAANLAQATSVCANQATGITLSYPKVLVDVATKSAQTCMAFASASTSQPVITVQLLAIDRIALVEKMALDTEQAVVDSFAHASYQASSVRGNRQGLPYAAYILAVAPTQSVLVEVVPSLGQFESAGVAIAQSIALP
jgi:hypothetical protein